MKIGALILGILGALGALGLGQISYGAGSIMGYFAPQAQISGFTADEIQMLAIGIPLLGLVGSALVFYVSRAAGLAMLMSAAGILFTLGFNTFTLFDVLLLGIGGLLALFAEDGPTPGAPAKDTAAYDQQ